MVLFIPITFRNIANLRDQGVGDDLIRNVLIRVASRFTPIVQRNCPVDTGRLKRSLRVELLVDDSGVAITSEVFYAGFVEFGTKRMRPREYAQSIIPDLIGFGNELLSSLGQITINPISRVGAGEQSGNSTTQVSQSFFERIQTNRIGTNQVQTNRIETNRIQTLGVSNQVVDELFVEAQGVI